MPTQHFEITVSSRFRSNEDTHTVVADASQYIAYADQTDLIGYHASVEGVSVSAGHPPHVTFQYAIPISSDDELKRFMDEMAHLSRVSSVEKSRA